MLNLNIPPFKCGVRKSWFTKEQKDSGELVNCYAFGLQSYDDRMLTFHVVTDFGYVRSRVPLSEIFIGDIGNDIPSDYKQLWNCFSHNAVVTVFDYLKFRRCEVMLKDKTTVSAVYIFTVDWYDNSYSEEPTDYKCAHVLVSEHGYLLAQPNNRITKWNDPNFVVENVPDDKWKVDTEFPSVEQTGRWAAENTEYFHYQTDTLKIKEHE